MAKKKPGPLYNYKSPRDYEVFNWGNEADPPFKLKSGNAPPFKLVGSSPHKQTRFSTKTDTSTTAGTDSKKESRDIIVKGGGKRTMGQIFAEGLTGGLDAVYGTGKVKYDNTVQIAKNKEEVEEDANTISENIIAGNDNGNKPGSYVKPGGKATGEMKDYPLLSEERKKEYDAKGWKYDDTIKGYNKEGNKIEE